MTPEQVTQWARGNRDVPADCEDYVADKPLILWLDQETFPWHDIPDSKEYLVLNSLEGEKDDGVVDFEIEYARVWQKPS